MKKITYLLIAVTAAVSVASCVKELTPEPALTGDGVTGQVFTVSLPAATRTALVDGKTVWAKGDSIWVSNGTETEAVVVPEAAWGQKEFDFATQTVKTSEEAPQIYVVYPYSAAAGVKDGKVSVTVPAVQDGLFENANIAAAVSWGYHVELKNVTGVFKVTVPDDAVLYSIAFSAAGGKSLAGTCAVDFSGEAPVLTPTTSYSAVSVPLQGQTGEQYVAVIPGTFDAGFKMTAAGYSFEAASEVKESKVANTVAVNDLVDLGTIGTDLQPIGGDGSEANPFLIENLGHIIALTNAVNEDVTFEGQYLKVTSDIGGITEPIGKYPDNDNYFPFQGDFDGGGHTLTVEIDGANLDSKIRLGLFSCLTDGASIHDLTVAGTVTSTGDCQAGVVGRIDQNTGTISLKNVTNKVNINTTRNYIGGITGYITCKQANTVTFEDCTNEGSLSGADYVGGIIGASASNAFAKVVNHCTNTGTVSGSRNIGGISGFGYYLTHTNCTNAGAVTSTGNSGGVYMVAGGAFKVWPEGSSATIGVGGIIGLAQNCTVTDNTNSGNVTGLGKVGGIVGTSYWTSPARCTNSGTIKGTQTNSGWIVTNMSLVGGIVGHQYVAGNISACSNSGSIIGTGAVGGIVGYQANGSTSNTIALTVSDCENTGDISGNGQGVGGISGVASTIAGTRYSVIRDCTNKGRVVNASNTTGGIVGDLYDMNNGKAGVVYNCVNEGDIQSTLWVGGIVGYAHSRATGGAFNVYNCENKGNVVATRPDDAGEASGGIVGAVNGTTAANSGLFVKNCLNNGSVQYREASHVKPYVGGIVGHLQYGGVENCVNTAYVGPEGGFENVAEGATGRLGTFVGSLENTSTLKNAYFPENLQTPTTGTDAVTVTLEDENNVRSYDRFANLNDWVGEYFLVYEALNEWAKADSKYYSWAWNSAPVFVR